MLFYILSMPMLSNPILLSLFVSVAFNLLIFLFAFKYQTDKLTDITYAFTFGLIALVFFYLYHENTHPYRMILAAMPVLWAIRLGAYLFRRVLLKGKDHRFDVFRHIWWRFGRFFIIQGVSIWVIALPYTVALSSTTEQVDYAYQSICLPIGATIFLLGFLIETIADAQKFKFRSDPINEGKFMAEGLFSIVRFPNYTGEIMLWTGIFIATIPVLKGIEWATIISPIWIAGLLIGLSGIPFLERSNQKRYGHLDAFQKYKKDTKKLIPGMY